MHFYTQTSSPVSSTIAAISFSGSNAEAPLELFGIDGVETLEQYCAGGYHPVMIGDVLHERYRIVDKFGCGGYSTVWLAHDTHLEKYVAVKVGIADSAEHEAKVLRALSVPSQSSSTPLGRNSIPILLDEFKLSGPNGIHPCYTTPPARGDLKDMSANRLFPLAIARALLAGLVLAIAYVHSRGYVHDGIHLRNVLAKLPNAIQQRDGHPLPPNISEKAVVPLYLGIDAQDFTSLDAHIILSDFGEAFAPDVEARRGEDCHTPFRKTIIGGDFITADEVVSQHIEVLGPMPVEWWDRWTERGRFFDATGNPLPDREDVWPPLSGGFEQNVQKFRRKRNIGEFGEEETAAILDLMRRMLKFRPGERLTADQVLQSEWMLKWALPAFHQLGYRKDKRHHSPDLEHFSYFSSQS
ncbi:kinase-like domain-containing protein [Aspergillus californicus]